MTVRWDLPAELYTGGIAQVLQRVPATLRMRADWMFRRSDMARATLPHMGMRAVLPQEFLSRLFLSFRRQTFGWQTEIGILRIRLVCPQGTTGRTQELFMPMLFRSNPTVSKDVIECAHAWAFKDSSYLGQSLRPDVSTAVTSEPAFEGHLNPSAFGCLTVHVRGPEMLVGNLGKQPRYDFGADGIDLPDVFSK